MKILLFSFTGRIDDGNCSRFIKFINNELIDKNIKCSVLNARELNINPCKNCNYECFYKDGTCPINDDVLNIYRDIMKNDVVIMVIPVYSGAPPSMYFSFRERSQAFFKTDKIYEDFKNIKKGYIVIGNKESGGLQALDILLSEKKSDDEVIKSILIQSNEYGQKSIEGNLIKFTKVKIDIKKFLDELIYA